MDLRHKVAVVTGGTSGLGASIAESLLIAGAHVTCAARREHHFTSIAQLSPARARYAPVDILDRYSIDDLFAGVAAEFGRVDIVVANAGITNDGLIETIDPDDWRAVIDTNVTGTFNCIQSALPHLPNDTGRIIIVSSALSTRPSVGASAYCVSKAALDMLTKVCAEETAERGITVNAVAPGFIDTGMGQRLTSNDIAWDEVSPRLLSNRKGAGYEIGDSVRFLASHRGNYINGHVLEVNGGLRWS